MKKLFVALFTLLLSAPTVFAQFNPIPGNLPGIDVLLQECYQNYSELIKSNVNEIQNKNNFQISTQTVNGEYTTIEQNDSDIYSSERDIGVKNSAPETKTTDSYVEVKISVPEDYIVNKYISFNYNGKETKAYIPFLSENSILLFANEEDISFKLDYDIDLAEVPVIEEGVYIPQEGYLKQALTFTIKYSPKYFTFKRVSKNYNFFKKVEFKYKGKDVILNTKIYPVLIITTPQGKDMTYVLEPNSNFENIYNDFEFVRKGHKFTR